MQASSGTEAAEELFRSRQYAKAAQICEEVLAYDPDNLSLRLLRARALMALRRDEEAKREIGRVISWHGENGEACRLLGELAIRSGKLAAALTFLRQAVRLSPGDSTAVGLLATLQSSNQPTVAVEKLPAATATVGCPFSVVELASVGLPSAASSDEPDSGERAWAEIAAELAAEFGGIDVGEPTETDARPPEPPESPLDAAPYGIPDPLTPTSRTSRTVGIRPSQRFAHGTEPPEPIPRLFGEYLVSIGAMTPSQLDLALSYQRRAGVRIGAAVIALGFLSEPSVEWAAHDYHIARMPYS